jgi:ABC-type Mn2+/Zn2+ transport system permease subunit
VALVVAPAAAALRIVDRIGSAYLTATAIAVASGIAGIYASYYLDLAAGASIALAAVGAFLATLPFGGARAQRVRPGSRGRIEILPRG